MDENKEAFLDTLNLTKGQRFVIKIAIEEGITEEQLNFINKPEFNGMQMAMAGAALKNGLTESQVSEFYKPDIPYNEMRTEAKKMLVGIRAANKG